MPSDEEIAKNGLAINLYLGKWKKAQELAETNERTDDAHFLPYWERVRLLYLELGGGFNHQPTPVSQEKETK